MLQDKYCVVVRMLLLTQSKQIAQLKMDWQKIASLYAYILMGGET